MRAVPSVAAAQFGAFTTQQAHAAGWTESALRHAARRGTVEHLRYGAYGVPLVPTGDRFEDRLRALRRAAAAIGLTNRGVPLSHAGAAALTGLPLLAPGARVCVSPPRNRRGDVPGAHVHDAALYHGDVTRIGRLLLTSVPRTVVDLGREAGVDDALAAADFALRRGLTSKAALDKVLARCTRSHGLDAARRAVAFADPRAESVLESLSRLRIHRAGLPAPHLQPRIFSADGRFCARVDFYWDEFGVVGECDGKGKYLYRDDDDPLVAEKDRQGRLEDAGLIVVRWVWRELDPFTAVEAKLTNAFARAQRPERAARNWFAMTSHRATRAG